MLDAVQSLNADRAIDGMTVNQLCARAKVISKQITQLVSYYLPCQCLDVMLTWTQGKSYYNTENFFIVGAMIYLGNNFVSSLCVGDEDLLGKLLTNFKVAKNPRAVLHKAKVALQ